MSTGEPDTTESGYVRFGGGPSEKGLVTGTSSAAYSTSRRDLREPEGETPSGHSTRHFGIPLASDPVGVGSHLWFSTPTMIDDLKTAVAGVVGRLGVAMAHLQEDAQIVDLRYNALTYSNNSDHDRGGIGVAVTESTFSAVDRRLYGNVNRYLLSALLKVSIISRFGNSNSRSVQRIIATARPSAWKSVSL